MLQTWLRLQAALARRRPRWPHEPIDAPLFVVGPPRTGTTILLELLALDPQLRAPLAWEALYPLPVAEDPASIGARRRELAECEQEFWADIDPEFMTMHELASDLPCECVHFLAYDFAGPYWSMLYDTPSFTGWQLEHLETLGACLPPAPPHAADVPARNRSAARWLLKSPGHLSTLPAAVRRVSRRARDPHASRSAQVHRVAREPARRCCGSCAATRVDVAGLGPMMEMTYQMFLEQVIARARRRNGPERPHRRLALPRPHGRPGRDAPAGSTSSSGSTGPPVTTT